jgi:hypothetical protein
MLTLVPPTIVKCQFKQCSNGDAKQLFVSLGGILTPLNVCPSCTSERLESIGTIPGFAWKIKGSVR